MAKDKKTNQDYWGGNVPPPGESSTSQYARSPDNPINQVPQSNVHGQQIPAGANLRQVSIQEYLASHPSDPKQRNVTPDYQGYKDGKPLTVGQQLAIKKAVAVSAQERLAQSNQPPQPQGQPAPVQDVHGTPISSQADTNLKTAEPIKKPKGKP